jgi:hypothetical protein
MRFWVSVAMLFAGVFASRLCAAPLYTETPRNTVVWTDTIRVDSLAAYWSDVWWQDDGGEKMLIIEAQDTAAAGFANDSACVRIELYQVQPSDNRKDFFIMKSRAHPDSSTYPFGSRFLVADSLNIKSMDSAAVYLRGTAPILRYAGKDTTGYKFTDAVSSNITAARGSGAFAYFAFATDPTPGVVLRVTGLATNAKRGTGSRWVFRWVQVAGNPVRTK